MAKDTLLRKLETKLYQEINSNLMRMSSFKIMNLYITNKR